jgi:hypothetical protein
MFLEVFRMKKILLLTILLGCGLNQEKLPGGNKDDLLLYARPDVNKSAQTTVVANGDTKVSRPELKALKNNDDFFEGAKAVKDAVMKYRANATNENYTNLLKIADENKAISTGVYFAGVDKNPKLLLHLLIAEGVDGKKKLDDETKFALINFLVDNANLGIRDDRTNVVFFATLVKLFDLEEKAQFVEPVALLTAIVRRSEQLTLGRNTAYADPAKSLEQSNSKDYDWLRDFISFVYDDLTNVPPVAPLASVEMFYAALAKTSGEEIDEKLYDQLLEKGKKETAMNATDLSCVLINAYDVDTLIKVFKTLNADGLPHSPSFIFPRKRWGIPIEEGAQLSCEEILKSNPTALSHQFITTINVDKIIKEWQSSL